jgi:thiosulfate/3-mercaptopyruvate sulfurtransferase
MTDRITTLISAADLEPHLNDPNWLVFDCRFSLANEQQGLDQYHEQHISGAYYAHLNDDLSGRTVPGKTGRHPLPDRDLWLERVVHWGINPDLQVIAYDDMGGAFAGRLWWLLRWIGHARVAVLDGGWQTWCSQGRAADNVQPKPATPTPGNNPYQLLPSLTRQVSVEDVLAGKYLLVDARDEPRYRGEIEPIDAVAGHIPGALCLPFAGNLSADGLFKSPAEIKARFSSKLGESSPAPIACYCGSGVTATHNILAMVHGGMAEPALYPGSWSEWILDPTRPVEH